MRRFVHQGGGYLGICAGAYLGSTETGHISYLDLLRVTTSSTSITFGIHLWNEDPSGLVKLGDIVKIRDEIQ